MQPELHRNFPKITRRYFSTHSFVKLSSSMIMPAKLHINTDQMQTVYQQGTKTTIYFGQMMAFCLSKDSPKYAKSLCLKFRMECLKSGMYWSTQETMQTLVSDTRFSKILPTDLGYLKMRLPNSLGGS
jgi:hypothetical protein